ncbi:MAG: rod-binding protein [Marivibrio sp.]|uniref:rod-binding protein n=1 Tax=Marivibrio sp. TaxID=2039719 RepID=UPI0032EF6DA1
MNAADTLMTSRLAASAAAAPGSMTMGAARDGADPTLVAKAREAAVDFEAVFLTQMLKPMFDEIDADGPFGGGQAEAINRDMLVDEYGQMLARSGGVGLADKIMSEILKMQESQQ